MTVAMNFQSTIVKRCLNDIFKLKKLRPVVLFVVRVMSDISKQD